MLTDWIERAYAEKDSIHYCEMLHPDFEFEFLPEDAMNLQNQVILPPGVTSWPLALDCRSARALFGSSIIGDISLNISIDSNVPSSDSTCVECRNLETTVVLRVVTHPDDPDPIILAVDSPQSFVLTKDPTDSAKWVILRQFDRPLPGARTVDADGTYGSAAPATEVTTWGAIKGIFR